MRKSLCTLLALFVLSITAAQAYIEYTPNQFLAEEVAEHPYRILPRGENYSLAIDADFYKPVFLGGNNADFYKWDYYHGNGYWMTIRAEFKPVQRLSMNLKLLVTQGTSSNGPTFNAVIVPLVALTYRETVMGIEWETRLSDIGRQTVGTGLFVENKDTMGGYVRGKAGDVGVGLMVDGTGSFRLDGGLVALELQLFGGILGATTLLQETATPTHPPQYTFTLFSKRKFSDGLGYGIEGGGNSNSWAGIGYITYENWLGDRTEAGFHLLLKPQVRYYGSKIMGDLAGNVQHNYISYEQNDLPFTSFMNIMSYGDDVVAYAAQANLEYVFNYFYRVYAENEFVFYDYRNIPAVEALYFRTGFKFYPFKEREDYFGFLIGNKYLVASNSQLDDASATSIRTYTAPNSVDLENKPLFLKQLYVMANYTAKF